MSTIRSMLEQSYVSPVVEIFHVFHVSKQLLCEVWNTERVSQCYRPTGIIPKRHNPGIVQVVPFMKPRRPESPRFIMCPGLSCGAIKPMHEDYVDDCWVGRLRVGCCRCHPRLVDDFQTKRKFGRWSSRHPISFLLRP